MEVRQEAVNSLLRTLREAEAEDVGVAEGNRRTGVGKG
jgi:hypothetical protein